jgi:hypothetical protein
MPKKPSKTAITEVLHAGQPSSGLVAELRAHGERVTTDHLVKALGHLEAARVGFVSEAIATGILLLAKKQTLKHGEWQPVCAELWEAANQTNRKRASDLPAGALDNFTRSLRHYCFLAQHFLADLEQGTFQPDGKDAAVALPAVTPVEVLALDTLPQEKRIAVYNAIERFVAGRSLRRMLIDFRRAESAADQEEIDETDRRRKSRKPERPGQMDFFEDMLRPIQEIELLFDDVRFVERTDKAFWTGVADKLETQARRARAMAKTIK